MPSGPVTSGDPAVSGVARRLPSASNSRAPGPVDENGSLNFGVWPNAAVLMTGIAATSIAPGTSWWPLMTPDPMPASGSLMEPPDPVMPPLRMYLIWPTACDVSNR